MFAVGAKAIAIVIAAVITSALSGCIAYESSTQTTRVQNPSGDAIFANITLHETSVEWLLTQLGNPEEISQLESGSTVFRYENLNSNHTYFQFLPAFSWRSEQQQATHFWFEIQQDRIVRCWSSKS